MVGIHPKGLGLLLLGASLLFAPGCASTAGWGPPPPVTAAPVSTQQGAPRFVQTTGMRLTRAQKEVTAPSWIRVQDCAIVAISSPSRYACPDGKTYTSFQLYRGRSGS
jgi:hypothetical protein